MLAPGDSTVVELIFDSRRYKSKMRKYATIYSNDPAQQTVKIYFSTFIDESPDSNHVFGWSPTNVSLSKDTSEFKVYLENKGESQIHVTSLGPDIDGLSAKVKDSKIKPGRKSELKFEWKNDFEKENIEKSYTFLVYGDGIDSTRFSVPLFIHGTDPTPPKTATSGTHKSKTVQGKRQSVNQSTKNVKRNVANRQDLTNFQNDFEKAATKTETDKDSKSTDKKSSDTGSNE